MRMSGMLPQPSARMAPPEPVPTSAAVSRLVRNPATTPSATSGDRWAPTPSSSKAKVPSPPGVVASAVTDMAGDP
jgi:hypothetical protein